MGKKITIKEISKIMGVSASTVTNALAGQPNVSDELRQAIKDKANELGYKPNFHARAMVKNGITLAVITAQQPAQYMDMVIKGMEEEAERLSDYKITLKKYLYHDNRATLEAHDCVERMIADGADGVIFASSFMIETYIDTLKKYIVEKKIPIIGTNDDKELLPYISIVNSNTKVIAQMVAQTIHIQFGSNAHIGVITTSSRHANHMKILTVFKEECKRYGMTIVDILENDDSNIKSYECTHQLLTEHPELDVIYMTSYDSVSVCKCIENMGMQEKVKVIGHDIYQEMVSYMQKDLLIASIFQNPQKQGRMVVRILAEWILGEKIDKEHIHIKPELVMRSNLEAYMEEHGCTM